MVRLVKSSHWTEIPTLLARGNRITSRGVVLAIINRQTREAKLRRLISVQQWPQLLLGTANEQPRLPQANAGGKQ
jgi:hypothetical protein